MGAFQKQSYISGMWVEELKRVDSLLPSLIYDPALKGGGIPENYYRQGTMVGTDRGQRLPSVQCADH